jgi:hypothetical protein
LRAFVMIGMLYDNKGVTPGALVGAGGWKSEVCVLCVSWLCSAS